MSPEVPNLVVRKNSSFDFDQAVCSLFPSGVSPEGLVLGTLGICNIPFGWENISVYLNAREGKRDAQPPAVSGQSDISHISVGICTNYPDVSRYVVSDLICTTAHEFGHLARYRVGDCESGRGVLAGSVLDESVAFAFQRRIFPTLRHTILNPFSRKDAHQLTELIKIDLSQRNTVELAERWNYGKKDLPPGAIYAVVDGLADRLLEKRGGNLRDLLGSGVEDLGL